MAAPTTFLRVHLNPVADSRVPWAAQLVLALVLVAYGVAFVMTGARPEFAAARPWLHTLFLVLAVGYLGYVLLRTTPVLGAQTYFELTPDYLVHKPGAFRPKVVFGAEELARFELSMRTLRIIPKTGTPYQLSLKQVRGARKRVRLRQGLEDFARRHGLELVAAEGAR